MIFDSRVEFCDATALNTGGAGTYLLGNVVDLGGVTQDIGNGQPAYWYTNVDTAATSGGSATAVFTLASDAQAAIATDGSATVHAVTAAIAVATLIAGYLVRQIALPIEYRYERYLGVLQTTAVAAFTAGKINSFITLDPTLWTAYADATN